MFEWRNFVCGFMVVVLVLPTSLMAQDSGRAMLHSDGDVSLNGNPAPASSAIFKDDLIQTEKNAQARIDAEGSTVTVEPETIVQFEGDELVLDHGRVQVNTWRGMKVRVNCLTVIPRLPQEWTRYDVIDVDGKVRVLAYQSDVNIHYGGGGTAAWRSKHAELADVTVYQGGEATREERCGAAAKPPSDAGKPFLDTIAAKGLGIAAVAVITCYALCRTNTNPVSPSTP